METLESSLRTERKWRNVQRVLPETFELVVSAMAQQTQLIRQLQSRVDALERVESTAARSELAEERLLTDTKRRMSRLRKEVSLSLEQQQTAIQDAKETAQSGAQRQEEAIAKAELSLKHRCCKMEESLRQQIANAEQKVEEQHTRLEAKVGGQMAQLKTQQALNDDRMATMQRDMVQKMAALERKLATDEARRDAAVVPVLEEIKVATPEVPNREMDTVHEDLVRVSKGLQEAEAKIEKQFVSWRQELVVAIGKKLCKNEATKLLSRKMDTMDAWKQLAEKADSARVEEIAGTLMDSVQRSQERTLEDLDQLRHICEAKADAIELVQVKHNMHNLVEVAESIQHELCALKRVTSEKMTVADAKELLDSQATLNGLQEAMKQVEGAARFATKSQLDTVAHQVQAISRQLRSEIYQARYIWKNGCPSAKQTIQWSSQVVNTNADIFLWQCGSDEVLVNGEPGLLLRSPVDERKSECSTSCDSPVVRRIRHSAGNIAGLAVDAFLALPARALVSISYDLDEKAQGFLNLRKL